MEFFTAGTKIILDRWMRCVIKIHKTDQLQVLRYYA